MKYSVRVGDETIAKFVTKVDAEIFAMALANVIDKKIVIEDKHSITKVAG